MSFPCWTQRGSGLEEHRGLAPLGLEPVGRRFIDELMPGLTGATVNVRYYSFFAWALWTFHQQTEAGAFPRTEERQAWWLGRMENLFRFATLYAEPGKNGIVGVDEARTIPLPSDDPSAPVPVGRALRASAFVPAYYRASFLALGCAEPDGRAFSLTLSTGVPLGEAFHRVVESVPDADAERRLLLAPTDTVPMRVIQVFADALCLRPVPVGDPENALLADLLLRVRSRRERPDLFASDRARARSLTLLLELLRQAGAPLEPEDFHALFTSGRFADGRVPEVSPHLVETWTRWQRYQEREHERVALYALLHAAVPVIQGLHAEGRAAAMRTITQRLWENARDSEIVLDWLGGSLSGVSVSDAQRRLLDRYDPTGVDEERDLESLSYAVQHAGEGGEVVGGAILLLLLITAHWRTVRPGVPEWARQTHLRGGAGRISLEVLSGAFDAQADRPVEEAFGWVMESCVLGQAIRVAVEKLASRAYRFFLAMGDDGFEIVRRPPDSRFYYPPRIRPAFSLVTELGLLERVEQGAVQLAPYGEHWLREAQQVLHEDHHARKALPLP